jgi:2-polyprenyl-3-methyl-5-hydroxy-6-metoxy-1,4-benzoquinol methylase
MRLLDEYRKMSFDIDIFLLSEAPKGYDANIVELVGLPTADPWSLPFLHRELFIKRVNQYDLFIYSEDDTLIREENLSAYMQASAQLPENILPGFVRFEVHANGDLNFPDIHAAVHWQVDSVGKAGSYVYASLTNDHSACYVLTQAQLMRAIASGGYTTQPHSGRYDMLCAAATDPYTQCGFQRVICLSHIRDFELHHLPNAYLDRMGISEMEYRSQVESLLEISTGARKAEILLKAKKSLATPVWDCNYYEDVPSDLLAYIPKEAQRLLSVGCGSGATEMKLMGQDKTVKAIPLDSVIAGVAVRRGVNVLSANIDAALRELGEERFDVILIREVLQHVDDPIRMLRKLRRHLTVNGQLVGSVPNLSATRRRVGRVLRANGKWKALGGQYSQSLLHCTSKRLIEQWLESAGYLPNKIAYAGNATLAKLGDYARILPRGVTASTLIFTASCLPV